MRFALSAAAAVCGLLLLGLAFFGQPELYLRQAREQWDSLTEPVTPEPAAANQVDRPPAPAVTVRMEELQREVLQLRDELIARREEADRAREALALAQAQQQAAEAQRQAAEPAPPPPPQAAEQPPATLPAPILQTTPVPERQVAAAPSIPDRHDVIPQIERHAAPKPLAAAPRPAPRQEAENTQSVLARLRQASPVAAEPTDAEPPPERVNRGPSPALRRLIIARSALANGQVEEARRLLQEAQLELVFRPVAPAEQDSESASRAAADVAHALEALSAADLSASRGYIDRAVGDSTGSSAEASDRGAPSGVSGYAPAYPER